MDGKGADRASAPTLAPTSRDRVPGIRNAPGKLIGSRRFRAGLASWWSWAVSAQQRGETVAECVRELKYNRRAYRDGIAARSGRDRGVMTRWSRTSFSISRGMPGVPVKRNAGEVRSRNRTRASNVFRLKPRTELARARRESQRAKTRRRKSSHAARPRRKPTRTFLKNANGELARSSADEGGF